MKILIISGFLGAGKTTFIKEMCKKTGRDFCIFENEYAQADIDKALLMQNGQLNVWELTENCICCSGKQDFASSILTISNTIDPEYLIVEPTGVAKLSAVIENIRQIQYDRISILQPIVIVDGNTIQQLQKNIKDIYEDQLLNAGKIVVSKLESSDEDIKQKILNELKEQAPNKDITVNHYSTLSEEWWKNLLTTDISGEIVKNSSDENVEANLENLSLTDISIPSPVHLISFLEMITFGLYGKMFRAKGFLPCNDKMWLQFDLVNGTYQITEIEKQEQSRVVFIGENLLRTDLRKIFRTSFSPIDIKKTYNSMNKKSLI